MDIDTRLIRHVLALARHRNFARAAEQLHLSQPALSRSISRLEETLGVALFDRTRKGVIPTMELTLFGGQLMLTQQGVQDAEKQTTVPGGISPTDHRTGPSWPKPAVSIR